MLLGDLQHTMSNYKSNAVATCLVVHLSHLRLRSSVICCFVRDALAATGRLLLCYCLRRTAAAHSVPVLNLSVCLFLAGGGVQGPAAQQEDDQPTVWCRQRRR
jgi:hypothetical protein